MLPNQRMNLLFILLAFIFVIYLIYLLFKYNIPTISYEQQSIDTFHHIKPTILLWTTVFDAYPSFASIADECPLFRNSCQITSHHDKINLATAVVFHASDIHHVSGDFEQFNKRKFMGKVNVFYTQETYHNLLRYHRVNMIPNIYTPYGNFFLNPNKTREVGILPINLPFDRQTVINKKKIKGILWLVSNCQTPSKRDVIVDKLSRYIRIDIGGKCSKKEGGMQLCPRTSDINLCNKVKQKYYFLMSLENEICHDYITEKYWENYQLPVILIVMRREIYEGKVPTNSFIAVDDFKGPKSLADYLKFLMDNPVEYAKYFRWRSEGWAVVPKNLEGYRTGMCRLCEKLLMNGELPHKPITDIMQRYNRLLKCLDGDAFVNQWND